MLVNALRRCFVSSCILTIIPDSSSVLTVGLSRRREGHISGMPEPGNVF